MLRAYVDESGQRGFSPTADDFFVVSGVIMDDAARPAVHGRLSAMRHRLGKPPGTVLHFSRNIREHAARVYVCREIGSLETVTVANVVLCKRLLTRAERLTSDPQTVTLYTLRYLLERLSWIARDSQNEVRITFAHVRRFSPEQLDSYLARLREMTTSIEWAWVGPIAIDRPETLELLQIPDIVSAAVRAAFQPDRRCGVTEPRYLREFAARLYRRLPGPITSYGMKLHPGIAVQHFPWVRDL